MVELSIIIVNYNVKEFLLNLLESIQYASRNLSVEIIVVDNNSNDGSIPAVKIKYPSVITIENKTNIGFGKANNQALEICKGNYILLINPDTLVRENTFEKLISFLENNPEIGLAGCKVLNPDGTLQLPCRRSFPKPWVSFTKVIGLSKLFPKSKLFAKYNLTYLDENQSYEVDAVSGSFMMLTRESYTKTKGFDPVFFMYGEDLDLCYRVQENGMKVFYYSETEIIHYKGESTKRSTIDETRIFYHAMHLFVRKHFSNSFLVEAILQFGIIIRKLFAFANVNKYIILGATIDFIAFYLLINLAEKYYSNETWQGFPEIFKPWVYIIPAFFQIIVSAVFGSYRRDSLSVLRSFFSLCIGLLIITSSTFFLKQYAFSRAVVLITYGFSILVFSLWRIIMKYTFLKSGLSKEYKINSLVVGTDRKAVELTQKLTSNLSNPYKIIGLIGNDINEIGKDYENSKVVGIVSNLRKVIRENKISNVIFSSDSVEFDKVFSSIAQCQGENVNFLISGNELDFMVGKSSITHIEDIPLLKVNYNISLTTHKILKRLFDFLFSLIVFILFYPISLLISKILKKTNYFIDAILSIPYVIKGEKSIVGPYKKNLQPDLYLGKTGITGLWYIENVDEFDENENRRLNLFYAKNQNIWLDLEIIGRTIAKYLTSRRKNG